MKNKSILSLLIGLLGFGALTTSCEDMLTPDMNRYSESFSGRDTVYFYYGILRNVQDMIEQNKLVNDLRGDLADTTAYSSDSVANIINYKRDADGDNKLLDRSAYYKVINQCNFYLASADTMAKKNNIYYMRREYAQVLAIRAWTYLQLVQNYGSVPFITDPVDNAGTGWETNPPKGFATADNLVDLLKKDLETAILFEKRYGYPNYPTISTGSGNTLAHRYMCFYSDLVLADLYLLKGESKEDYVNAAKHYYAYLDEYADEKYIASPTDTYLYPSMDAATYSKNIDLGGGSTSYYPSTSSWTSGVFNNSVQAREMITMLPSAANSSFGRVLTRSVQIYGFDPHSSNSTSSDVDGENVTTSGQVSVQVNYKNRQVSPSASYINLAAAQPYVYNEMQDNELSKVEYFENAGDARIWGTAPYVRTDNSNTDRYVTKYCTPAYTISGTTAMSPQFRYYFNIYRLRQVYLRYAEALNRAGFPRTAFAILRNGIHYEKMPILADSIDTVNAQRVYYVDEESMTRKRNNAAYIGSDETRRALTDGNYAQYLDFSENHWMNGGIHELGCGASSKLDTLYSYNYTVARRMLEEANRVAGSEKYSEMLLKLEGDTPLLPNDPLYMQAWNLCKTGQVRAYNDDEKVEETIKDVHGNDMTVFYYMPLEPTDEEINAVETLIADESALETAFEGTRMGDLIRFARHKDVAGVYSGTEWLAWKIARRSTNLAPYASPGIYNTTLFNTLMQPTNWYLAAPVY